MFAKLLPTLLLALTAAAASAAELVVTKTADSNDGVCNADCSLREAIQHANLSSGEDRIVLPAGVFLLSLAPLREGETIVEEDNNLNGDLDVMYNDLHIVGAGKGKTFIDAAGNSRLFDVHAATRLRLEHLALRNGRTSGYGGAIRNRGDLQLNQVAVSANAMRGEIGGGGAIANFGRLDVASSRFNANTTQGAPGYGEGGAIYNQRNGWLRVRNSSFSANISYDDLDTGRGGAVYNEGVADLARSSFTGNKGGEYGNGSAILNAEGGFISLSNATLSNNQGYYGQGAFSNGQSGSRNNPTSEARLVNVTIAANTGPVALLNLGRMTVRNSLVAGNHYIPDEGPQRAANCRNGAGALLSRAGFMLGEDNGGCQADLPISDAGTFSQVIEPLSTLPSGMGLHALREHSPAIDAGLGSCTSSDQRSAPRPQDGNGDGVPGCDLGAHERDAVR